jgi:hypothetical protein
MRSEVSILIFCALRKLEQRQSRNLNICFKRRQILFLIIEIVIGRKTENIYTAVGILILVGATAVLLADGCAQVEVAAGIERRTHCTEQEKGCEKECNNFEKRRLHYFSYNRLQKYINFVKLQGKGEKMVSPPPSPSLFWKTVTIFVNK